MTAPISGSNAIRIILQRVLHAVLLLSAVLVFNFVLLHLAPGDVVDTISQSMGGGDAAILESLRAQYGLDKPLLTQLGLYLGRVARFDLGYSFFYNESVAALILARLPATLLLVITAQLCALIAGVFLGVVSAKKPFGIMSHCVTALSLIGFAAPVFWTGTLLLIFFALEIPLFPAFGMQSPHITGGIFATALNIAHHLFLPALTLAFVFIAVYARLARAVMLEALGADYIRTARAKGLTPRSIIYKHALRNAAAPVVTLAGLHFSAVISGAVLVEAVFSWPGLGALAHSAIVARDAPLLLGILLVSALVVITGNLLTDAAIRALDPRIGGGRR